MNPLSLEEEGICHSSGICAAHFHNHNMKIYEEQRDNPPQGLKLCLPYEKELGA